MRHRVYKNFEEYSKQQTDKIKYNKRLAELIKTSKYADLFRQEFKLIKRYLIGTSALCMGARNGVEVAVLREMEYNAIGIDLYPLSKLVEKRDFHDTHFEDGLFDIVYTNSLDHSLDIDKMLKEAKRLLRKKGMFIARYADISSKSPHESCFWDSREEVQKKLSEHFKIIDNIDYGNFMFDGIITICRK